MKQMLAKRWFRIAIGAAAFIAMVAMASYQRRTGPTWPVSVDEHLGGAIVSGELIRTQAGEEDARVAVAVNTTDVQGELVWRRLRFIIDQARSFEESNGGGLQSFLDWADLQSAEGSRVHEPMGLTHGKHAERSAHWVKRGYCLFLIVLAKSKYV